MEGALGACGQGLGGWPWIMEPPRETSRGATVVQGKVATMIPKKRKEKKKYKTA